MDFPVIISFYTKETPYQLEVQNLIASCEKYCLKYDICGVESHGSWEMNCAYKPFFILERLEKWEKPVLWVDADGVFLQKPCWQDAFYADLSVRIEDLPCDHPSKVISSTIFVRPEGKDLIRMWIRKCHDLLLNPNRTEEFWDQIALRDIVLSAEKRISSMPLAYAKIFDHPKDQIQVEQPVIEHFQASRRYKGIVNAQKSH